MYRQFVVNLECLSEEGNPDDAEVTKGFLRIFAGTEFFIWRDYPEQRRTVGVARYRIQGASPLSAVVTPQAPPAPPATPPPATPPPEPPRERNHKRWGGD